MISDKDTLLDGPVVGVQWSTDGTVAPLDFEVQWCVRTLCNSLSLRLRKRNEPAPHPCLVRSFVLKTGNVAGFAGGIDGAVAGRLRVLIGLRRLVWRRLRWL